MIVKDKYITYKPVIVKEKCRPYKNLQTYYVIPRFLLSREDDKFGPEERPLDLDRAELLTQTECFNLLTKVR